MEKDKVLTILVLMAFLMLGYGVAYSVFDSSATISSSDTEIASFIFNSESTDQFQLSLNDLKPNDVLEYNFLVSNNYSGKRSDINIEYLIGIRTYYFIPLTIELYKMNGEEEELIIICDETHHRNAQNELMCDTEIQELRYDSENIINYKLKVSFVSGYDDEIYSNLVDYIDIKLESWQKIKK